MATCFSPIQSVDVLFPGSSNLFMLKTGLVWYLASYVFIPPSVILWNHSANIANHFVCMSVNKCIAILSWEVFLAYYFMASVGVSDGTKIEAVFRSGCHRTTGDFFIQRTGLIETWFAMPVSLLILEFISPLSRWSTYTQETEIHTSH